MKQSNLFENFPHFNDMVREIGEDGKKTERKEKNKWNGSELLIDR